MSKTKWNDKFWLSMVHSVTSGIITASFALIIASSLWKCEFKNDMETETWKNRYFSSRDLLEYTDSLLVAFDNYILEYPDTKHYSIASLIDEKNDNYLGHIKINVRNVDAKIARYRSKHLYPDEFDENKDNYKVNDQLFVDLIYRLSNIIEYDDFLSIDDRVIHDTRAMCTNLSGYGISTRAYDKLKGRHTVPDSLDINTMKTLIYDYRLGKGIYNEKKLSDSSFVRSSEFYQYENRALIRASGYYKSLYNLSLYHWYIYSVNSFFKEETRTLSLE